MQVNEDLLPRLLREGRPDSLIRWPEGSTVVFEEKQKLNSSFQFLLVFDFILITIILMIAEGPWWTLIIVGLINLALYFYLRKIELRWKIDKDGISISMPMTFSGKDQKTIRWNEITSVRIRRFAGFLEQSGYGKKVAGNKSFYNLDGNKAFEITTREGKQIVIGTRRTGEIEGLLGRFI